MPLDERATDRQAQAAPSPTVAAVSGRISLKEPVEHPWQVLRLDAAACVGHRESRLVAARVGREPDNDSAPRRRESDRIVEQIAHHLPQLPGLARDQLGPAGFHAQIDAASGRERVEGRGTIEQQKRIRR
jgi:hypothetical protein